MRQLVEVETTDSVYIFEFKVGDKSTDAIVQIEALDYTDKYAPSDKNVFLIGAVISHNKRTLGRWKIEKIERA